MSTATLFEQPTPQKRTRRKTTDRGDKTPWRKVGLTCTVARTPDGGMDLVLPYPPSANAYFRTRNNGQRYAGASKVAYCADVADLFVGFVEIDGRVQPVAIPPITGDVAVTYRFYRPAKMGDLMNREKVLSDALNGRAWVDDKQIVEAHLYRHDDKDRPRVEVTIRPASKA